MTVGDPTKQELQLLLSVYREELVKLDDAITSGDISNIEYLKNRNILLKELSDMLHRFNY